ncbi:hypothetical protein CPT_Mater103 [Bacillus phage Mater]|uniref:Uncharacterized protein n=1 Tax=Bacillus phage Mater TaxID=1540090 RepID=A0A0A0RMH4_9CAUD|nr:hypothetical protein CPT_Mater103 [Bacillus phage Mater]AIW03260.1 hypothetical protein CPT_Mater103 [Bacillus phage Mater]
MFAEKKIHIFDKEAIKVGSFITFCKVMKDYDDGRIVWDEYNPQNAIVNIVTETYIEVHTINRQHHIYINKLVGSPAFDETAHGDFYKILGTIPNAVKE